MKFTIDKNIILENLMNVARAISTKNVIPVLNGIKFEMTEEGLYLTASDSELTIKSFIEKKDIKNVEALGNIIIQSKFIVDIIRKMPSDIIDFEVVDGLKIKLTSGSSECSLNCLDSSEYPQIDLEEHNKALLAMQETAVNNCLAGGLLDAADSNAQKLISNFVKNMNDLKDYTVNYEYVGE